MRPKSFSTDSFNHLVTSILLPFAWALLQCTVDPPLNLVGGFPEIDHSEDIYTGFLLGQIGYVTKYVPTVVSKGVCPDNLDNFIAQQYRWCHGSMAMPAWRDFHTDVTLTLRARLSYWSGFLYYIGTAVTSVLMPIPAIIMTWFYSEWVRPANMIWLVGILILWFILYPIVMTGKWRIEVLRLQTVYGFAHLFNIIHLGSGRLAEWHTSGRRDRAPIARSVQRFYTYYLGAALAALFVGLVVRSLHGIDRFWPMIGFSLLNFYIAGPLVWSGIRYQIHTARIERSRKRIETGGILGGDLLIPFTTLSEGASIRASHAPQANVNSSI